MSTPSSESITPAAAPPGPSVPTPVRAETPSASTPARSGDDASADAGEDAPREAGSATAEPVAAADESAVEAEAAADESAADESAAEGTAAEAEAADEGAEGDDERPEGEERLGGAEGSEQLHHIIKKATKVIEKRRKVRDFEPKDTKVTSLYNIVDYLEACRAVREGKTVLWPNEITYGLTANAFDDDAVQAIYDSKGRIANPIPILTHKDWIGYFGYVPWLAQALVDVLWPDNISIVVPKRREIISDLVTAGMDSVALMCPNAGAEALARDICLNGQEIIPIACTSANISGQPSITNSDIAVEKFFGAVDIILTGPDSNVGMNTTIIDFSVEPYVMLRRGPVSLDEVFNAVPELRGKVVDATKG